MKRPSSAVVVRATSAAVAGDLDHDAAAGPSHGTSAMADGVIGPS